MSLKKIQQLRKITSLGMMECKDALLKANGDINKAIEDLYSKGTIKYLKKNAKKVGFVNAELNNEKTSAVIIEFNTQTDFVSKNDQFLCFVKKVTNLALENNVKSVEQLLETKLEDQYVKQHQSILVNQFKENISISKLEYIEAKEGILGTYVHNNKIAVVININKQLGELAHELAIHVTAMKPEYISVQDIEKSRIEKERKIIMEQVKKQHPNKQTNILDKIIDGKLNKLYQEIVLLNQIYVKDKNKSIESLLKENSCKIVSMCRLEMSKN